MDWKQITDLRWQNQHDKNIFMDIGKTCAKDWRIDKQSNGPDSLLIPLEDVRRFLNKKEAIKFAEKWMEKHPRG